MDVGRWDLPPIAHFVKPLPVPTGDIEALYSLWQEVKQKDVEHFFGVFKKKTIFLHDLSLLHLLKRLLMPSIPA